MIYTLTLNPSIDYIVRVNNYKEGLVNRTQSEDLFYGGKGINTSVILTNLGVDNIALGFVGGYIGKEFERLLYKDGVKTDFVYLADSNTRINIKIKGERETDINAVGPAVSPKELDRLLNKIQKLKEGDYITLAGSVPASLPKDIYVQIAKTLYGKNINIVVDAERNLLTDVLTYSPFLIKPNHYELGDIFKKELNTKTEIISAGFELQKMGARNIFISMAGDGGILITENKEVYSSPAPSGKVLNSTGAGDSLVAGFLAEYSKSQDYKKAFAMGLCAGSASAFSERLATKFEIEKLYNKFSFDNIESL